MSCHDNCGQLQNSLSMLRHLPHSHRLQPHTSIGSAPEELYLSTTDWMPVTLKAPSGKAWWHSAIAPAGWKSTGWPCMFACPSTDQQPMQLAAGPAALPGVQRPTTPSD